MLTSDLPAAYLASALASWEASSGRRYPWRDRDDAYALAVAEVLLQKTRAAAALPTWAQLLERFPTAADMAAADDDELTALVAGLGLGRQRSQRLREVAQAIATGARPGRGLGPYGRGVVALASGGVPDAAPVDGNVARVVTRVLGATWERGEPRKKPEVRAAVSELVAAGGLDTLYGLVDLGASVCLPARPRCPDCPLQEWCAWAAGGA